MISFHEWDKHWDLWQSRRRDEERRQINTHKTQPHTALIFKLEIPMDIFMMSTSLWITLFGWKSVFGFEHHHHRHRCAVSSYCALSADTHHKNTHAKCGEIFSKFHIFAFAVHTLKIIQLKGPKIRATSRVKYLLRAQFNTSHHHRMNHYNFIIERLGLQQWMHHRKTYKTKFRRSNSLLPLSPRLANYFHLD